MHYSVGVVIEPGLSYDEAHAAVEKILAPFVETYDDTTEECVGWWDFWSIGGRWSGIWDGYDPDSDPVNIEICRLCDGGGLRMDKLGVEHRRNNPDYTCNGCDGKGRHPKWPTQRAPHGGDIASVATVLDSEKDMPFRLVLPDAGVIEHETWDGERCVETPDWERVARAALEPFRSADIAIVDVHV